MPALRAKWLIAPGSAIVAAGSGALYYLFPNDTAKVITSTFGISSYDAARDILIGTITLSVAIFGTFAVLNAAEWVQKRRTKTVREVKVDDKLTLTDSVGVEKGVEHAEAQGHAGGSATATVNVGPPPSHRRVTPESIESWGNILMFVMVGAFFVWLGYDLLPLALSHPSIGTYGVVVVPEVGAAFVFAEAGRRLRRMKRTTTNTPIESVSAESRPQKVETPQDGSQKIFVYSQKVLSKTEFQPFKKQIINDLSGFSPLWESIKSQIESRRVSRPHLDAIKELANSVRRSNFDFMLTGEPRVQRVSLKVEADFKRIVQDIHGIEKRLKILGDDIASQFETAGMTTPTELIRQGDELDSDIQRVIADIKRDVS
jgi:hypothetical protein